MMMDVDAVGIYVCECSVVEVSFTMPIRKERRLGVSVVWLNPDRWLVHLRLLLLIPVVTAELV